MRKYRFSVDEETVSVYPCEDTDTLREYALGDIGEGEIAVLVFPVQDADFGALSFDKNNYRPREPQLTLAALSCFFKEVRGYPRMSIDVKLDGKFYELALDEEERKCSVKVGKCKILCTKTVNFADGIDIAVRIVQGEKTLGVVACKDSDTFDDGRLRLLLSRLSSDGIEAVLAVSMSGDVSAKSVGTISFSDAIKASALVLTAEGIMGECDSYFFRLNGQRRFLSYNDGDICYRTEIKYLY